MSQILIQENFGGTQGYQSLYPTNITPEVANMFVNSNGAQYTNDVLKYLGKYCMYWWKRRKQETITTGTEATISSSSAIGASRNSIAWSKDLMTELDIFDKGTVTYPSAATAQILVDNAPCYVGTGYGSVYKIPAGATFSTTYSSTLTLYMEGSNIIANSGGTPAVTTVTNITTTTQYTDWEYLQSTNRNTYPDSGTSGDYEYQFLNIPFEKTLDSVKIQTGSYVGTGTYGASNPCSLTFDAIPQVVIISLDNSTSSQSQSCFGTVFIKNQSQNDGIGTVTSGSAYLNLKLTWSNNSLSWYDNSSEGLGSSGSAAHQLNFIGGTYYWAAF